MSIALDLPDENELAAESQANAADAAELELAEDAATAVEEGDEIEEEEAVEEAAEEQAAEEQAAEETEIAADDPEATLLEEPDDEEQPASEDAAGKEQAPTATEAQGAPQLSPSQSPARPLTPHQPPKSAALVAYEHRRAEARDRYEGTMFEWRKLEAAAKAAKERWKGAEDQLFEVLNEGGDFEEEELAEEVQRPAGFVPFDEALANGIRGSLSPDDHVVAGTIVGEPPIESPAATTPDPNAWRRVPISELHLENIKGLGAKKIEQITLACPTIGQLEDLRAGFDGLKALDGIGQAKADAIEEAILNWLSKNRDKEVLAAAAAGGEEQKIRIQGGVEIEYDGPLEAVGLNDDGEIVPAEELAGESPAPTEAVEDEGVEVPPTGEVLSPDWHAVIEARSQAIFFRTGDLSSVSPDDCLSQNLEDSRYFESGWEAYNAGNDLIDCGYVPGPERDDWLRGWMSAKLTNEEGWQGPGSEGGKEGGEAQ